MPSKNKITPILSDTYYHIFNRGNNYENIFYCEDDYYSFLKKFKYHLKNVCDIFAYALLPNHYHFLIRVGEDEILFSKQFKQFVQEYTYRINSRENRNGNLFLKPFRRLQIDSNKYFSQLIFYIHYNPTKHELIKNFKKYPFSSYQSILSNSKTILQRKEVLNCFNGRKEFIVFHEGMCNEDMLEKVIIE